MWVKKNSNFKILLSYWLSFNAHQSVSILKFDWDDLSISNFFDYNAASLSKSILETNKTSFASYSLIQ